jgi:hypothetical protein
VSTPHGYPGGYTCARAQGSHTLTVRQLILVTCFTKDLEIHRFAGAHTRE